MQQANRSPQALNRRPSSLRDPNTQNSQPIQPLKLPPLRRLDTPPIEPPTENIAPVNIAPVNIAAVLDAPLATAVLTRPAPLPLLDDRPPTPRKRRKSWEWSLIGLVAAAGIFGGIGTSAVLWLSSLPPMPKCEDVTLRSLDVQRLFCAQEAAHSGKLPDLLSGINLLKDWAPDHPLKQEAQRLIADWSDSILAIAQSKIKNNDMTGAVAAAGQIPASSPRYDEAQEAIAHWQTQWKKGEATVKAAQASMQKQDWFTASRQVLVLGDLEHAYWRVQRADELSRQILEEKQARQVLIGAQKIAKVGQAQELGEAIALLRQVPLNTYAAHDANAAQKQWSKALLAIAIGHWQQGNHNGAMAIAQKIPFSSDLSSAGQDLVRFSQAQDLAGASRLGWEPNLGQMWQLMEAIAAIQQVSPQSFFYAQAQLDAQNWQAQLNDLKQLQMASWVAQLGQRPQLEFAVAQAQAIAPQRPRRSQAQAMLSRWKTALETLEDRPYLAKARQIAKGGTLENLEKAIVQARKIVLGRALRKESQTYIAQWQKQVETLVDQPILAEAEALAAQGQLAAAIERASQIKANRVLYGAAQRAIALWQPQPAWQPPVSPVASPAAEAGVVVAPPPTQYSPLPEQWTEPSEPTSTPPEEPAQPTPPSAPTEPEPEAIAPSNVSAENPNAPPENSEAESSYEGFYDERYLDNSR